MANNFKPWVDSPTAGQQVQSASVFATDAQRVDGFKAGDPASALRVNSALRQANIVVAGLMQMCDDIKTLPDGLSLMSTVTQVKNAIKAAIDRLDATVLASAKSYTDTREGVINGKLTDKQTQITSNKNRLDALEPRVDDLEDEVAALGGSGGGNIGSYWAVIPNSSIPTYYGDAFISFSFTTNNGYDENLIGVDAELKDILLASSVNIYKTQTDYASEHQTMDMSELCSTIYNGDGTADGKQIIKGKASIDNGGMKDYDCLLFVYESGTDVYLTIGLVEEDKNTVYMSRDVSLDGSESTPTAVFFIGNSQ